MSQRGNRRPPVFFEEADYAACLDPVASACRERGVRCLARCLMPNHVHLILVPSDPDGVHGALADAHRRYSRGITFAYGWAAYLWQGRFASDPMVAGLVAEADNWRRSSARAHPRGAKDGFTDTASLAGVHRNWRAMLRHGAEAGDADAAAEAAIEAVMRTGRPLGGEAFIETLEAASGRTLKRGKPGRKPKSADSG